MRFSHIKITFLRLTKHKKLIGIGSAILLISTFLPWYADLDSYRIGDEFLGITGPAFFVGIAILMLSGLSFTLFAHYLLEKRLPRLPVKEAVFHMFTAVESLFLLVLVNSIFFHPKFGVNITLKESRFGMTVAIIGSIILLIGAYLQNREEIILEKSEGKLEPLIKLEPTPTPSTPVSIQTHQREPRRISPYAREEHRGFLFGEAPKHEPKHELKHEQTPKKEGGGSYMWKNDL